MNEPLDLLSRDFAVDEPPDPRRRIVAAAIIVMLLVLLTPPLVVLTLRWVPPPTSAFMLESDIQPVRYLWVPAQRMPEALRKAVVASEDQKFWTHNGFDFDAINKALEHNRSSRRVRGASTISQQVAKNLFLWPGRSYVRKGLEVSFTVLIEALWPKDRILETYLNIAEFGPGLYGVQAAAQKFFGKDANQLTAAEAATLVAVLPSPRVWRVTNPGPYVQARTDWILGQIGERARFSYTPSLEPALPSSGPEQSPPADSSPETGEATAPAATPDESQQAPGTQQPGLEPQQPGPQQPEPQQPEPGTQEPPAQKPGDQPL